MTPMIKIVTRWKPLAPNPRPFIQGKGRENLRAKKNIYISSKKITHLHHYAGSVQEWDYRMLFLFQQGFFFLVKDFMKD